MQYTYHHNIQVNTDIICSICYFKIGWNMTCPSVAPRSRAFPHIVYLIPYNHPICLACRGNIAPRKLKRGGGGLRCHGGKYIA